MTSSKLLVGVAALMLPTAVVGQDFPVVDWGPMMQTEAMNSAMEDAARQGSGTASKPRTRTTSMTPERRAKLKSLCSQVRQHAAAGEQHPRLGWALGKCKESGL
ncbi:MAG: hypothetical protein ABWY12_16675 [Burkholderiales bacterium]